MLEKKSAENCRDSPQQKYTSQKKDTISRELRGSLNQTVTKLA